MSDWSTTELSERLYEVLLENMSEGFVICEAIRNEQGRLVDYWLRYLSPNFARRVSERIATAGRRQLDLRPGTPAGWISACHHALADGRVAFEYQEPEDGRWYEVTMVRVSDQEFGQLFTDITDRKVAEERRDQLFQELNHRVKNNLAVVSSILELQARQGGPATQEELGKAVDRIRAIADLHDALQFDDRGEDIDLKTYVESIGQRLAGSLFDDSGGSLDVHCAPVRLRTDVAVNLGLILNELVTNAAKHGSAGRGAVNVRVDLEVGEGELRAVVADDGPGFPGGEGPASQRLGWRLLQSLARGMGAEVRVLPADGAKVEVRVPLPVVQPAGDGATQ